MRSGPDEAIERVLAVVAASGDPVAIAVGNRGCRQALASAVPGVGRRGPWLDIVDTGRHLHLRTDRIASSWVIALPSRAGATHRLELFDARGDTIASVVPRAGGPHAGDARWRALLAGLPAQPY